MSSIIHQNEFIKFKKNFIQDNDLTVSDGTDLASSILLKKMDLSKKGIYNYFSKYDPDMSNEGEFFQLFKDNDYKKIDKEYSKLCNYLALGHFSYLPDVLEIMIRNDYKNNMLDTTKYKKSFSQCLYNNLTLNIFELKSNNNNMIENFKLGHIHARKIYHDTLNFNEYMQNVSKINSLYDNTCDNMNENTIEKID